MAERKVIIEVQVNNEDGLRNLGRLKVELKAVKDREKELAKEMKGSTAATAEQEKEIGLLASKAKALQGNIRELSNETSGLTASGLRFRDKMAAATKDALLPFGTGIAAVTAVTAIAVTKITQFVGELADLSAEMQALDRKAQIVFGEALPSVTAEAEKTANAMGLTAREFVNAAAGVQDLLVPLGFARERAAELSTEVVSVAGALSLWSGGQVDAAEAAGRIQKGLLGEAESLKELGIVIDQSSAGYRERIAVLQESEGITKEQARAMDILRQVTLQTADAQTNYADSQGNLIQRQAESNAKLREAKEALAEALTPALIEATDAQGRFIDGWAKLFTGASLQDRIRGLGDALSYMNIPMLAMSKIMATLDKDAAQVSKEAEKTAKAFDVSAMSSQELVAELTKLNTLRDAFIKQGKLVAAGEGDGRIAQIEAALAARNTADAVETLAQKRKRLTEVLKDAKAKRDALAATDVEGIAIADKEVAAAQRQIDALEKKKAATVALTQAQKDQIAAANAISSDVQANPFTLGGGEVAAVPFEAEQIAQDEATRIVEEGLATRDQLRADAAIRQITGLVDLNAEKALLEAEYQAGSAGSYEEYAAKMANIDNAITNQKLQAIAAVGNAIQSFSQLAKEGSAEQKSLATAAALINTFLGGTQVLRDPTLPTFLKIPMFASIIATGLSAVKQIQGFADGGIVGVHRDGQPIRRKNGDDRLVTAKVGEMFINEKQQREIRKRAGYDIFRAAGVPGSNNTGSYAIGGPVRGTALVNMPTAPSGPSFAELDQIRASAAQQAKDPNIFVRVTDINKGQGRMAQVTERATL